MENPNNTPNRIEMIDITNDNYRTIAALLRDELSTKDWINISLSGTLPGVLPADGEVTGTSGTDIAVEGGCTLPGVLPAVEEVAGTSGTDIAVDCGCSRPAVEWRLVLSAVIYRRTEVLPEGERRPITDVVPVWWEFHTCPLADNEWDTSDGDDAPVTPGSALDRLQKGQCPNNFSFTELKPFLIDYD